MRCRVRFLILLTRLVVVVLTGLVACKSVPVGQYPQTSTVKVREYNMEVPRYLLYIPEAYGKDRKTTWPLILFLHGMGECGTNIELIKKHPLPAISRRQWTSRP